MPARIRNGIHSGSAVVTAVGSAPRGGRGARDGEQPPKRAHNRAREAARMVFSYTKRGEDDGQKVAAANKKPTDCATKVLKAGK